MLLLLFGALVGLFSTCIRDIEASPDQYRYLGKFSSPYAAFTKIDLYDSRQALFVTSFPVPGAVDFVPYLADKMNDVNSIVPENIISDMVWPNEVDTIPEKVFGQNFVLTAGGFLVPGFRTGEILAVDVKNKTEYKISTDEIGYFYHLGAWYDVDRDGLLDVVSAKTDFPFIGPGDGKLVWFKNPGAFTFPWKETLLVRGPDVFFRIFDLDYDGRDEIVASIFVNKKLSVFYNVGNDFADPSGWRERVIDDALGSPFDVRVADLNNDKMVDLLVTNHQNSIEESAVFAYEVPRDIPNGEFVRHVIAMGFETTQPGEGQASPGSAQAFYPVINRTNEKPLIMVSGDGTQTAHLLRANSENPLDWSYTIETIIFVNNTVGGISVGDVEGDGYADFFIPNYDDGEINAFTFKP